MPVMAGRASIGIGGVSGNVLLGQQYELMPFDGSVQFLAFGDKNLVTASIFSGSDILSQPGSNIPFGAAEAAPSYPDHIIADDEAAEGDRLSLSFVNGNAAATAVHWRVILTPA